MSRVGKQPVPLPNGVEVEINGDHGNEITVNGPKGSLTHVFSPDMEIAKEGGSIIVSRPSDEQQHKSLHGLTRSLIANMVIGVSQGFEKSLELVGVGYRVQQSGSGITLNVMLSHSVEVTPRLGILLEVEENNLIHVKGFDKQLVGQTAAEIKAVRPPNPYTGKGIRYRGEQISVKPGKSARRVE